MYLNTEDGGKPGEGEEEQRRETGKGGASGKYMGIMYNSFSRLL
jgi:hypothetical protein